MATRAQKTKVGLFVLTSLAVLVACVLIIMGYTQERYIPYWVEFEESILGLGEGGMVVYMGVPVGTVDEIYVSNTGTARVRIAVSEETVTLREGVTAQLMLYSLAAGTMCVSLQGGEPDQPRLPAETEIPTQRSLVEAVSTQVEVILDDVGHIASEVRMALEGMEEGEVTEIMREFGGLLVDTRETIQIIGSTIEELEGTAQESVGDLREFARDLRELSNDVRALIQTTQQQVETVDIESTQAGLLDVMEKISALTENLNKATEDFDATTRAIMHQTDNVEFNLREGLNSLGETLESIRALSDYLQEDPASLIRGRGRPQGER